MEALSFWQEEDKASGYDFSNLCFCTLDLFGAGTETTATTLNWGLLYMIHYPQVQGVCVSVCVGVVCDCRLVLSEELCGMVGAVSSSVIYRPSDLLVLVQGRSRLR